MSQDRPVSKELAEKLAAYPPKPVVPITDPARLLGPGIVDVVQFRNKTVALTEPVA